MAATKPNPKIAPAKARKVAKNFKRTNAVLRDYIRDFDDAQRQLSEASAEILDLEKQAKQPDRLMSKYLEHLKHLAKVGEVPPPSLMPPPSLSLRTKWATETCDRMYKRAREVEHCGEAHIVRLRDAADVMIPVAEQYGKFGAGAVFSSTVLKCKETSRYPKLLCLDPMLGARLAEVEAGIEEAEAVAAKPRQGKRRQRTGAVRPLTPLQLQAMELKGKYNGVVGKIAKEMGIAHSTVNQHLNAAHVKLEARARAGASVTAKRLPHDKRGQEILADDEADANDGD